MCKFSMLSWAERLAMTLDELPIDGYDFFIGIREAPTVTLFDCKV